MKTKYKLCSEELPMENVFVLVIGEEGGWPFVAKISKEDGVDVWKLFDDYYQVFKEDKWMYIER